MAVARRLDKVLIPPGEYKVHIDGESKVCRVNTALLVPCKPRVVTGRFETNQQALDAVRRQVTLSAQNCMNKFQAAIAVQHFADEPGCKGLEFLEKRSGYCEVLVDRKKALGLFIIYDPNQRGLQTSSPNLEMGKTIITRVAFREVEAL